MELVADKYKQTEIGILPADWDITLLSEIVQFSNGKAHEKDIDESGAFTVVNSKFISTEGQVSKRSKTAYSLLKKGDITMVMSDIPNGKALAKCFLVEKDNIYTLNQRICSLRTSICDNIYLYYILNRNNYFLSFDSGSGQTNLRRSEVLSCPIPLPPTKSEQTAIATALSDMDALISSLEKLIEKKRMIKQGAMQELLKPKEGWELVRICDVAEVVGGSTPNTNVTEYWNGEINWFTPTEVGNSKYLYNSLRKISDAGLLNCSARILPVGAILLTSRAGIGDLGILLSEACTNQGFQSLVVNKRHSNEFIYYLLKTMKSVLLQYASGSTFLEISPTKVRNINIYIPNYTEQVRIADILCQIDEEIDSTISLLRKYRLIKNGMMQCLLNGKIRLV